MQLDPRLPSYYRKAAVVIKLLRFAALLGFVVFSVFCIGFFKDNITIDNLRYLIKYIDLSSSDSSPSKTEISISTDESSEFFMLGKDLAVVSNSGVGLYGFSGSKLYQYDHTYASCAAVAGANNLLVYDTGGNHLEIYSPVSKVLEMSFEYPVRAACINELGYFAVVNSESTFRSGIIVFDSDGEELMRWMSPDKYVTGVALNSNASVVTCSAVHSENGSFYTELISYNTLTGEKVAETTLADSLVLKIGYASGDSVIYVLTDSEFICFDSSFNVSGRAAYNPENAKFFRVFDDCFILAESNNLAGNSMIVKAYSYEALPLFECSAKEKIIDAEYKDSTLYLLGAHSLFVYDYGTEPGTLTELAARELAIQYNAVRADDYGRYILISAKKAERDSLAALLESQMENSADSSENG